MSRSCRIKPFMHNLIIHRLCKGGTLMQFMDEKHFVSISKEWVPRTEIVE